MNVRPKSIPIPILISPVPLDVQDTTLVSANNNKRTRTQRVHHSVSELGNVGNTCELVDKFYTSLNIYNIVHDINKTPKTYKAAMSSVNAAEWLKAIDTDIAALQQYKT